MIPLRPLGVGEILDGAITSIRENPKVMLGLTILVATLTQLISVPLQALLLGGDLGDQLFSLEETATAQDSTSLATANIASTVILVLTTGPAVLILTGILTVVVSRAVLGERMDAGSAWRQARPRLPALLGVTLLILLAAVTVVLLLLAPAFVAGAAGSVGGAVALGLLGGLAAVAAVVYLFVAWSLAPVAVVLEKQGVLASLRRSRRLVHPNFWRVLGILLLINVLAQLIAGLLSAPFVGGAFVVAYLIGDGETLNIYRLLPAVILALGTIIGAAITWPFTAVSTTLIYVDQRMRREALDIELTRAAGSGQSATSSATPGADPTSPPYPPLGSPPSGPSDGR